MNDTLHERYTYRDVPKGVYSSGVEPVQEGEYSYWIASAEKALCDVLYTKSPVANQKEYWEIFF